MRSVEVAENLISERDFHRPDQIVCPGCGESANVSLTRIAYMFVACDCSRAPYTHLVEQLWHIECLRTEAPAIAEVGLLSEALLWLRHYKKTQQIGLVARLEHALYGAPES